ncbi:MAG: ABC transporter substrate-binding protein [Deltaproteobacteria bacterium]|nr:ABC transporter substrate-binding protein [Deltaproteobacteria bacterium]
MRALKSILIIFVIIVPFSFACSSKKDSSEIRIGGIFALTGLTHEVSIPYADGIRNCIEHINEKGGINGRTIRLIDEDYGYLFTRAVKVYRMLVEDEDVHAVFGWGTGDSEYLMPKVTKDRIPFMSASYSSELGQAEKAPYNFLIGVTYSDQIRIALKYILINREEKTRRPRVALIYSDTAFGRSPIADGRDYAASNDMDIVAEEIVSLDAFEAVDQLKRIKEKGVDYTIIQQTVWATSVILKDARKLGLKTSFIGLNWCVDEKLIALAEDSAEGFLGLLPFLFTDEMIPGIREISEYNAGKGIGIEGSSHRYIQGWTTARVMAEGIRRAGDDLSGPGIKKGLENIKEFSTGGITAPISFSSTDHRGTDRLRIGIVRDGKWKVVSDYLSAK